MKKLCLIFLSLMFYGMKTVNATEGNTMNVLHGKPVFELKVDGFGTKYRVKINDVTIFDQPNANGKVTTTLPVNHYMRSGPNVISVSTWANRGQEINKHAYVNVELVVSEHNRPEYEYMLASLNYKNSFEEHNEKTQESSPSGRFNADKEFIMDDKGEVQVEDVVYKKTGIASTYTRELIVPSSLPLWAFFKSDELPNYFSMSDEDYYQHVDELLVEYMKVHDAITNKKTNEIISMFSERNRELDAAFYYPVGTYENKIRLALEDAANDDSAELVSIKATGLNIFGSANNRLASLHGRKRGAAIGLNYKNGMGSYGFDMIFRRQNGKWILTR